MSTIAIIVFLIVILGIAGILMLLLFFSPFSKDTPQLNSNLRNLVSSQRLHKNTLAADESNQEEDNFNLAIAAASEAGFKRSQIDSSTKLTIAKKLFYADWPIKDWQFKLITALITLAVSIPVKLVGMPILTGLVILMVPLLCISVLDRFMNKRFEKFDADYPVLLLSYVSLLKTGMSTIAGLEAAAKGLDKDSTVRMEVGVLVERLRLGLSEEQAINAFGETINHPELALFVQSLLLSRRVGGTLSNTLERLARQVRKRQQFRKKAKSEVAMEAGSIVMISIVMTLLLVFLSIYSPGLVMPALSHPFGQKVFQAGISLVAIGFFWSKKITNIKV